VSNIVRLSGGREAGL